jgi:hypothetical protein
MNFGKTGIEKKKNTMKNGKYFDGKRNPGYRYECGFF